MIFPPPDLAIEVFNMDFPVPNLAIEVFNMDFPVPNLAIEVFNIIFLVPNLAIQTSGQAGQVLRRFFRNGRRTGGTPVLRYLCWERD